VVIATCDHCIKLEEVTIHVNANTPLPISQFEVTKHPSRDLAVLVPPFLDMAFRQLRSLKLWEGDMPDGSEVLVLGYPTIPQRQPALAMTRGIVMAETFNYRGDADYLTVSSQLSGGSSGSPVLNLCGYVVGVAEEITQEQVQEGIQAQNFGHAIPAKYLRDIL
jgi:S1-C subfamily serine protease